MAPRPQLPFPIVSSAPIRHLLPRLGAVAIGGFLGGALRYVVTVIVGATSSSATVGSAWAYFDFRLLLINILGVAAAVGLVLGPLRQRPADDPVRLLWTTGALGGLTTYSSLLYELGRMWQLSAIDAVLGGVLSLGCGALAASGAVFFARRRVRGTRAEL